MSTIDKRKGQAGGRAKLTQQISERAVYGLRNESQTYEDKYSKKQVADIVKRYATIANKRLAAIEEAKLQSSSPAYKHIEKASYSAFSYVTGNKNRFKTSSKQSYSELVEELYQLHQFLFKAKTSTIAQIREVNRQRLKMTNTWLESKGLPTLTSGGEDPEDAARKLGDFFRSKNIEAFADAYGSDTVVDVIEQKYGDFNDNSMEQFTEMLNSFIAEAKKQGDAGEKWLHFDKDKLPLSDLVRGLEDFDRGSMSWK